MKRLAVVVLTLLAVAATADDRKEKAVKAEQEKLQGKWKLISTETVGKSEPVPADKATVVTIDGDKWTEERGAVKAEWKITLDPSQDPKTLSRDRSDGKGVGGTQMWIYKVEKDALTICNRRAESGEKQGQPKEFKTSPEGGGVIHVYKRVEK